MRELCDGCERLGLSLPYLLDERVGWLMAASHSFVGSRKINVHVLFLLPSLNIISNHYM